MATYTEEEERALEKVRQTRARVATKSALEARLKGDPAAAQAVNDSWAPYLEWQQEQKRRGSTDRCRSVRDDWEPDPV